MDIRWCRLTVTDQTIPAWGCLPPGLYRYLDERKTYRVAQVTPDDVFLVDGMEPPLAWNVSRRSGHLFPIGDGEEIR